MQSPLAHQELVRIKHAEHLRAASRRYANVTRVESAAPARRGRVARWLRRPATASA